MTQYVVDFDHWIRHDFVTLNTALEELYFGQEDPSAVSAVGQAIKEQLVQDGGRLIALLLEEGNTDEGFDRGFDLLGNVGFYMSACRRHEITTGPNKGDSPITKAAALAMHLGASLGVTPRFATSHLTTHNRAINGRYKSFTSLADEYLFLDYNTRGIFSYKQAADALVRILPIGISHAVTYDLLVTAKNALLEVVKWNEILFSQLDPGRFFYGVRPYYKPHHVGLREYRGANAGDFAGINEIDMLLGLCGANNIAYSQLLVDKFLYMRPDDQSRLRDCIRQPNLLDRFLQAGTEYAKESWFQTNAAMYLEVCSVHGQTASQHHDQLVQRFIKKPADALPAERRTDLTASGPPLPALLDGLEKLRDLRTAAKRDDIPSRYHDLERLKACLDGSSR